MKKTTLFMLMLLIASAASAQYKLVDGGSTLKFTIKNLGFDVDGSFTGFKGTINFDPQNPANGNFDVSIDASTVNTDNSLRDSHLKDEDYFDVKNYPAIRFVSTKITSGKGGSFNVTGKLTIKNKSEDISFPFTAANSGDGYVFKGSFKINRRDYGIGGTSTISDELQVFLNVTAGKS